MIVVDSSAWVALFKREVEAEMFENLISRSEQCCISAVNYMETCMVLSSYKSPEAIPIFDNYLEQADVEIMPVTHMIAALARDAFLRYGKGRHKAGLNMGDCFSYALANYLHAPLLFKGNDFIHTDIINAHV